MKKLWITSLDGDDKKVQTLMETAKTYALDASGHFWLDDLENLGWLGPRTELIKDDVAVWVIISSETALASTSMRYGLSLLAVSVQAVRGHGFPIILLHDGPAPSIESLPTPLQGAEVLAFDNTSLGAKIVAKANIPARKVPVDYRLDIHAMPKLGVWFEVGPAEESWKGVLLGVCDGEIDAHGVGPRGALPEKALLEYPLQGMKLNIGEKDYTAWAVHNQLDADSSYFVRIQGDPESLLFGPLAEGEEAEVFMMNVK